MTGPLQREDGVPFRGARIVIADDFEMLRRGLKSLLGSAVCGEAENGQEAIQRVRELHPDLIILDWGMPVMNGFEAAKAIRCLAPQTRILVFSLHDERAIKEQALAAGADAFLHKTTRGEEILKTIEELLAPRRLSATKAPQTTTSARSA
jgi:DNA-binding NarL/FixJ family response regulator